MEIEIRFQQASSGARCVSKKVALAAMPVPGSWVEYAEGWGMVEIGNNLHLQITASGVAISGYGPQFTAEEIEDLAALGWEVAR